MRNGSIRLDQLILISYGLTLVSGIRENKEADVCFACRNNWRPKYLVRCLKEGRAFETKSGSMAGRWESFL